jgi:hypothetical protein
VKYLLMIETSGNQAYIYATNKLRENVGASELTFRAGTQWVLEAVANHGGPNGLWNPDPCQLRENVKLAGSRKGIEILLVTSGKAMILTEDEDDTKARAILTEVSEKAIKEAPGLDLGGAIVEFDHNNPHQSVIAVRKRFGSNRNSLPTPEQRFLNLPVTQPCAHSGMPASCLVKNPERGRPAIPLSAPSQVKRERSEDWHQRIGRVFKRRGSEQQDGALWIAENIAQLEKTFEGLGWLAVVHADGNGLGQIFTRFDKYIADNNYVETLRKFSLELDEITEQAFYRACNVLPTSEKAIRGKTRKLIPVVPLVMGGDDMTVVMDGRYALPFTQEFLCAFEEESANYPTVAAIAEQAFGEKRLGICAGVAIIKPHFPFHSAYDLAESLLRSAKKVKQKVLTGDGSPYPCAALDFHVLFDASYTGIEAIRAERLTCEETSGLTRLFGGPYVISKESDLDRAQDTTWAMAHNIEGLKARIEALLARDENGRRKLPNSQMHALREALFQGRVLADARLREVVPVYADAGLSKLYETDSPPSLFRQADGGYETRFLDALTSAPFWWMEG